MFTMFSSSYITSLDPNGGCKLLSIVVPTVMRAKEQKIKTKMLFLYPWFTVHT